MTEEQRGERRVKWAMRLLFGQLFLLIVLLAVFTGGELAWAAEGKTVHFDPTKRIPRCASVELLDEPAEPVATAPLEETEIPAEPAKAESDVPEIDLTDWRLALIGPGNPLPEEYPLELETLPNGHYFDARAVESLNRMLEDGNAEGLSLMICSAYRSVDLQSDLFERQIGKQQNSGLEYDDAVEAARRVVASPGESEHNLGLAADIVAVSYQVLDSGFAGTAEGQWLRENCAKYGFVLRYDEDKQDITQIIYEPWHFRYVGVEAATYMMENGLCLEEYLALAQ